MPQLFRNKHIPDPRKAQAEASGTEWHMLRTTEPEAYATSSEEAKGSQPSVPEVAQGSLTKNDIIT